MNVARKPLLGPIMLSATLGTALAIPMAFAQTTPTTDDGAMQSNPPATTPSTTDPTQAVPTAEPQQVTWADLDTDKDGSLTKTEVATVPSLTQVFDQADVDADGKLTAEEYKAFAAADADAGAETPPSDG